MLSLHLCLPEKIENENEDKDEDKDEEEMRAFPAQFRR